LKREEDKMTVKLNVTRDLGYSDNEKIHAERTHRIIALGSIVGGIMLSSNVNYPQNQIRKGVNPIPAYVNSAIQGILVTGAIFGGAFYLRLNNENLDYINHGGEV
jgi:predicted aconitase with swiveling domain